MNPQKRYEILSRLQAYNPNPTTGLVYRSPFELLIATMLSAKATNISVNKSTKILFNEANTPQSILMMGIVNLKKCIKSIGLFNIKSENIIKTCKLLLEQHNGLVPEDRAALEALPGVGRKIANVVLNVAFGWPTIAVDTHVFRVANRTHFAMGKNILTVEKKLLSLVPEEFKFNCHNWFVQHGRNICVSLKPKCNSCNIEEYCEYNKKYL